MDIKIQSESISFKEFADQHPNEVDLIPESYGMSGDVLFQIILQFSLNLLKELFFYIAKKNDNRKQKKVTEKKDDIVIIFSDGHALHVPLSEFGNIESVLEKVKDEYGKIKI